MNGCGEFYEIQPGDTLYKIAQKYNITVERLITANSQIEDPNQISVGQVICIPGVAQELEKRTVVLTVPETSKFSAVPKEARGVILFQQLTETDYDTAVFAAGLPEPESLDFMGEQLEFDSYAVMIRTISQKSKRTDYSILQKTSFDDQEPTWSLGLGRIDRSTTRILGIVLYDSVSDFVTTSFVLTREDQKIDCIGESYTVQPGDTLYGIAEKYNIPLDNLIAANLQLDNPNQISVGQVICIPTEAVAPQSCAAVLTAPEYLQPVPDRQGGVVLARRLTEESYSLTFGATGLPAPESLADGRFDAYLAEVGIGISTGAGRSYSAVLEESTSDNRVSTWSGTTVIPENPFAVPETRVSIMPYARATGVRTNPLLDGRLTECKR